MFIANKNTFAFKILEIVFNDDFIDMQHFYTVMTHLRYDVIYIV